MLVTHMGVPVHMHQAAHTCKKVLPRAHRCICAYTCMLGCTRVTTPCAHSCTCVHVSVHMRVMADCTPCTQVVASHITGVIITHVLYMYDFYMWLTGRCYTCYTEDIACMCYMQSTWLHVCETREMWLCMYDSVTHITPRGHNYTRLTGHGYICVRHG